MIMTNSRKEKFIKKYTAKNPNVRVISVIKNTESESVKNAIGIVLFQRFSIKMAEGIKEDYDFIHEQIIIQDSEQNMFPPDIIVDTRLQTIALPKNNEVFTYGFEDDKTYKFNIIKGDALGGYFGDFVYNGGRRIALTNHIVGRFKLLENVAAASVGIILGLKPENIAKGIEQIRPIPGQMNLIEGINRAILIDDTSESDAESAIADLEVVYSIPLEHKFAVFGSLNTDDEISYRRVGEACDPGELEAIITIGELTNNWLANSAELGGNAVFRCRNAVEAGAKISALTREFENTYEHSVVLFKGGADISIEEAIKINLANNERDSSKLAH